MAKNMLMKRGMDTRGARIDTAGLQLCFRNNALTCCEYLNWVAWSTFDPALSSSSFIILSSGWTCAIREELACPFTKRGKRRARVTRVVAPIVTAKHGKAPVSFNQVSATRTWSDGHQVGSNAAISCAIVNDIDGSVVVAAVVIVDETASISGVMG